MKRRVVITGLGVISPNATGIEAFEIVLRNGTSGIKFIPELENMQFGCQVGGVPMIEPLVKETLLPPLLAHTLEASNLIYGCLAGVEAWNNAKLGFNADGEPDWHSGCVFGSGMPDTHEIIKTTIKKVDEGNVSRLGTKPVCQSMPSSASALLTGILGLGNQVTSNASACSTGTEAILMAYEKIKYAGAKRMLAGSCEGYSPYTWAAFDSIRVLNRKHNHVPEHASRPLSATASGFVPAAGAGALVLEELESAVERGATIYAEVLGGMINSGGHRGGGSMTASNSDGVVKCIQGAIENSGIKSEDIDVISGHLTATMGDILEVKNWSRALNLSGKKFPYINAPKSLIGHCLSASGAIECAAVILQLHKDFIHPSLNCEDTHPDLFNFIHKASIVHEPVFNSDVKIFAKSSLGFGDVNSCIIFKKYK